MRGACPSPHPQDSEAPPASLTFAAPAWARWSGESRRRGEPRASGRRVREGLPEERAIGRVLPRSLGGLGGKGAKAPQVKAPSGRREFGGAGVSRDVGGHRGPTVEGLERRAQERVPGTRVGGKYRAGTRAQSGPRSVVQRGRRAKGAALRCGAVCCRQGARRGLEGQRQLGPEGRGTVCK